MTENMNGQAAMQKAYQVKKAFKKLGMSIEMVDGKIVAQTNQPDKTPLEQEGSASTGRHCTLSALSPSKVNNTQRGQV